MMFKDNIQTKYFVTRYWLILLFIGFVSCNDDNDPDDLFGASSTERMNEQAEELNQLLQNSPEGWKVTYFTDDPRYTNNDQQLGGFNFIFKFTDDKHVTMASDFSEETLTPQESEYVIKMGSTTKLSFATKNYIHLLSDAANAPTTSLTGQGYKGDFEFLYYGQDGDDLIFRSNREQIEIRFQKATAEDWNNIESAHNMTSNIGGSNEKSIFRSLTIYSNGDTDVYSFGYGNSTRYATVLNEDGKDISFGIAPTPTGIRIFPPIEINGTIVEEFTYNPSTEEFINEIDENTSVIIGYGSESFLVSNNLGSLLYDDEYLAYGTDAPTSQAFNNALNQVNTQLATVNYEIEELVIDFESDQPAILYTIGIVSTGEIAGTIFHNVDVTVDSNGIVYLTSGDWSQDGGFPAVLAPIDNQLINSNGLSIVKLDETFNYTNDVYTITPVSNPNFIVAFYKL